MTTVDQHGLIRFVRLGHGSETSYRISKSQHTSNHEVPASGVTPILEGRQYRRGSDMHTGAARDSDSFHMFSFPFSDWEREREKERLTRTPHTQDMLGYCSDQ